MAQNNDVIDALVTLARRLLNDRECVVLGDRLSQRAFAPRNEGFAPRRSPADDNRPNRGGRSVDYAPRVDRGAERESGRGAGRGGRGSRPVNNERNEAFEGAPRRGGRGGRGGERGGRGGQGAGERVPRGGQGSGERVPRGGQGSGERGPRGGQGAGERPNTAPVRRNQRRPAQ